MLLNFYSANNTIILLLKTTRYTLFTMSNNINYFFILKTPWGWVHCPIAFILKKNNNKTEKHEKPNFIYILIFILFF